MGLGSGAFCRCRGLWLRRSMPVQIREANLMPRSDKTANRARALDCPATTALAAGEPQAPGGIYREARSGEAAAETERNQRGEGGKPMAGLCLRRFVRWARCSYLRTARAWRGGFREARSGDAVAETERAQCGKGGKPMAGLCLRRFVRLLRCSDGAGLAGFIASAVTERSGVRVVNFKAEGYRSRNRGKKRGNHEMRYGECLMSMRLSVHIVNDTLPPDLPKALI